MLKHEAVFRVIYKQECAINGLRYTTKRRISVVPTIHLNSVVELRLLHYRQCLKGNLPQKKLASSYHILVEL